MKRVAQQQPSEQQQYEMMANMMKGMFESMIQGLFKEPENESVKKQCDILAQGFWNNPKIKSVVEGYISFENFKKIIYNFKQEDLDSLYTVIFDMYTFYTENQS